MRKIREVLRLKYELHKTHREIAASVKCSSATVSSYIILAKLAGINWPLPAGLNEEALHARLFSNGAHDSRKIRPDWNGVYQELRRSGMTLKLIWEEYRAQFGSNTLSYSKFCEGYQKFSKTICPVMRQVHKAGEKCFVDYSGTTVPWLNMATGEIEQAEIFVGCLGASSFTFVYASESQSISDWVEAHVKMFDYFGGVPECVVPDNLKSGVTKAHHYDPDINMTYQQLGEHYCTAIIPTRVRAPKDKASVESAVGFVTRQLLMPLRHHTFTSITEINMALGKALVNFNEKPFQKLEGCRKSKFEELDKPALKPLPKYPYEMAILVKAKVSIDYHVDFEKHYYSVPYSLIHQELQLRVTTRTVECFHKGSRVAVHPRNSARFKHSTLKEHMPLSHQAHADWTPDRLSNWAGKCGPLTRQFIEKLMAARAFPQQAFRACLGVFRLGEKFGAHRLEKACGYAIGIGAYRYKHIEAILKNNMDKLPETEGSTTKEPHENIRGPHYYQ